MINLKTKRRQPNAPLSAMSDIGFIMLIFIMLLSLINYRKEVKISYPEADQVERTETAHQLEVWIQKNGATYADGELVNFAELENLITQAYVAQPDTKIHILADRDTPYRHINDVVELLQLLQHRVVSFVVKENL